MSSAAEELHAVSFQEYLALEESAARRHEFVGGRIYLVAGGSERHDLAAGLVYEALAPVARGAGCRTFTSNRRLRAATSTYYPDVFVVCGSASHRLHEADAVVAVEVLSASTMDTDRREKALAYATLPSLQQYILVDPDRSRLEVATPVGGELHWESYGPGDIVNTGYGSLDIDVLYATLDRTATTME